MKAISLWQPWASLIAAGMKRFETRSWSTGYRGPIAIHAAKKISPEGVDLADELVYGRWNESPFHDRGADLDGGDELYAGFGHVALPVGCIVAVGMLTACVPTERSGVIDGSDEYEFGNFGPGRFAWCIENVRVLRPPVAMRGMQGLFDLPQGWLVP